MSLYTFRRETVRPGDTIDIPDNARDVDFQHTESETIVSWFEKQGESVV